MGYCSCGNWVPEGSTCSHCGGGGGSEEFKEYPEKLSEFEKDLIENDGEYDEDDPITRSSDGMRIIERYNANCDAESYSSNGDSYNAVKYFSHALDLTDEDDDKCRILSSMAREYEKMGDYSACEECWARCIDTSRRVLNVSTYDYIARKADFLYRRGRYAEAVRAYDVALRELN